MPRSVTWISSLADTEEIDAEKRVATLERAMKRERGARQQAEELLETKSRELFHSNKELSDANETLQASYAVTVEVFARLIQSRAGLGARKSVAKDARELGRQLQLSKVECMSLYKAALLCDVGKLSLPDESVGTPYVSLDVNAQREYHRHPLIAEATLLSIEPLAEAATIIRHHCERVDGTGFPDKITADDIPLAARVLAVTKAYTDLMDGRLIEGVLTATEAREFIVAEKGKRYDGSIVDLFVAWLDNRSRAADETRERKLTLGSLRPGCVTTRDVCDANGVLILAEGQRISESMINKLIRLQDSLDETLIIYTK